MDNLEKPKEEKIKPHFGLKKAVVVIGIVIVLNLFISLGIRTFGNPPDWDKYCTPEIMSKTYSDQASCEAVGGKWMPTGEVIKPEGVTTGTAFCQVDYTCQKEYQTADAIYSRNFFIVQIIAGIILILIGLFAVKAQSVSLGLSFGGLLALIVGTIRHWSAMDEYIQFIVLGVALVILIWLGYKKFKD